ncbi:hypothetical protein [Embleya sp. NPDC050493]|uniref:hypothetical protein n=1 Tax=Embleya sp. NPDC050493 TaxID=3363989 RepID=UPI0037BA4130
MDLVILGPPPPILHRRVGYIGVEDAAKRPAGLLMGLWAVDEGTLATVQPPTGPAWFAMSSDLERVDCLPGPVADRAEPPFPIEARR